ncbi:hypothetical protein [Ruegeria sp.]|uniref:hypothetical protein n=1 Tax=Ruegeria sp. TaxID=1879320 RepID=UPI003AFFE874
MSQYTPSSMEYLAARIDDKRKELEALEALHKTLLEAFGRRLPNEAADLALSEILLNGR